MASNKKNVKRFLAMLLSMMIIATTIPYSGTQVLAVNAEERIEDSNQLLTMADKETEYSGNDESGEACTSITDLTGLIDSHVNSVSSTIVNIDETGESQNPASNDIIDANFKNGLFTFRSLKEGYVYYWLEDSEYRMSEFFREVKANESVEICFGGEIGRFYDQGDFVNLQIRYIYSKEEPRIEEGEGFILEGYDDAICLEDSFTLATQRLQTPLNVEWIGSRLVWEATPDIDMACGYMVNIYFEQDGISCGYAQYVDIDNTSTYVDTSVGEKYSVSIIAVSNDLSKYLDSDPTEPAIYNPSTMNSIYRLYDITDSEKKVVEGCNLVDWVNIEDYFKGQGDNIKTRDFLVEINGFNRNCPITSLPYNINSLSITGKLFNAFYVDTGYYLELPCNLILNKMLANVNDDSYTRYDLNGHNLTIQDDAYYLVEVFDSSKEQSGILTVSDVKTQYYYVQDGNKESDDKCYLSEIHDVGDIIIDNNLGDTVISNRLENIHNITLRTPAILSSYNSKNNRYSIQSDKLLCQKDGELKLAGPDTGNYEYKINIKNEANVNISRLKVNSTGQWAENPNPFPNGIKIMQYDGDINNIRYTPGSAILQTNPDAGFRKAGGYVVAANDTVAKDIFDGIISVPTSLSLEARKNDANGYEILDECSSPDGDIRAEVILSKDYFVDSEGYKYYPKFKEANGAGYAFWDNDLFSVSSESPFIFIEYKRTKLGKETIGVSLDYTIENGEYIFNCLKEGGQEATFTLSEKEVNAAALERVFPIEVSILGKYSQKDKEDLLDSIKFDRTEDVNQASKNHIVAYAIENTTNKLGNVKLNHEGKAVLNGKPQGTFSWVYENQALIANKDTNGYYCTIKFTPDKKGDYKDYPEFITSTFVAVSKVTGIYLEGDKNTLDSSIEEDAVNLRIGFNTTGYYDMEDSAFVQALAEYVAGDGESGADIQWKDITNKGYIDIKDIVRAEASCKTIKINDKSYKDGFANKIQVTLKDSIGKTYTATYTLTLVEGAVTDIAIAEYKEKDTKVNTFIDKENAPELVTPESQEYYSMKLSSSVIRGNVDDKNKLIPASITLEATALSGESENNKTKLIWTSSDTSIATVKNTDSMGRKAVITFGSKSSGDAVITVKSADKAGVSAQIYIQEEDHSPVQLSNKITLNAYYNDTNACELPIKAQDGTTIESIEIVDSDKYDNYEIKKEDDIWGITTPGNGEENFPSKKFSDSKFKLKVGVKPDSVENAETEYYDLTFSLTVNMDKPSATIKQIEKPNLFLKSEHAVYTISSKTKMSSVKVYVRNIDGTYEEPDELCNLIENYDGTFYRAYIMNDNTSNNKMQIHFEIKYEGYSEAAKTITKDMAVATINKKPVISLPQIDVPADVTSANATLMVDNWPYELDSNDSVEAVTNTAGITAEKTEGGLIKITNPTGKTQTVNINVQKKDWSTAITVSCKFNVIKQPELVFETSKINMNIVNNYQDNGYISIPVSIKNSNIPITGMSYDTSAAKNSPILSDNVLRVIYNKNEGVLKLGFNKDSKAYDDLKNRAGSYSIPFTAKTAYGDSKKANLTINVDKKSITVGVSLKGSLNTVDRESGPQINYKLSNASTGVYVSSMELKNPKQNGKFADKGAADYFYLQLGKYNYMYLDAYWDAALDIKLSYQMGAIITLSDGSVIEWDGVSKGQIITVKPVQKLPKVALSNSSVDIYKKSLTSTDVELVPEYGTIETAARQTGEKNYSDIMTTFIKATEDKAAYITLNPQTQIKNVKSGKYSVTIKYTLKGQAVNTAPQSLKITANVKDIKWLDIRRK